jgi:hypothetical protein
MKPQPASISVAKLGGSLSLSIRLGGFWAKESRIASSKFFVAELADQNRSGERQTVLTG